MKNCVMCCCGCIMSSLWSYVICISYPDTEVARSELVSTSDPSGCFVGIASYCVVISGVHKITWRCQLSISRIHSKFQFFVRQVCTILYSDDISLIQIACSIIITINMATCTRYWITQTFTWTDDKKDLIFPSIQIHRRHSSPSWHKSTYYWILSLSYKLCWLIGYWPLEAKI